MKDKMDLAIGVALGSSIQIALFVIPFVVIVGWAASKPFLLNFDAFTVLILTGGLVVKRSSRSVVAQQGSGAALIQPGTREPAHGRRLRTRACVLTCADSQLRAHLPTRVRALSLACSQCPSSSPTLSPLTATRTGCWGCS